MCVDQRHWVADFWCCYLCSRWYLCFHNYSFVFLSIVLDCSYLTLQCKMLFSVFSLGFTCLISIFNHGMIFFSPSTTVNSFPMCVSLGRPSRAFRTWNALLLTRLNFKFPLISQFLFWWVFLCIWLVFFPMQDSIYFFCPAYIVFELWDAMRNFIFWFCTFLISACVSLSLIWGSFFHALI